MSRVLFVLIAVLVLAGGAFWLTTTGRTMRGARATEATPAAAVAREEAAPLEEPAAPQPEDERTAAGGAPAPVPTAPAPRREAAGREAELARAQWIDGRVLFPAGTPADEEVFVTANGKEFEDGENHRVAVARDGSFRVAFSEKTRTGRFELEARYLYLDHIERWKSSESGGKVVLAPLLGTRIGGRVRLPAGVDAAEIGGRLVLERTRRAAGNRIDTEQLGQHDLAQGLDFRFDSLPPARDPDLVYELSYDGPALVGRSPRLVAEAGKTLEVELELRAGTVLAGFVRDGSGRPLEKVQLEAWLRSSASWTSAHHREGESAADGSFRLGAFVGGEIELRAELAGFEPLRKDLGRLEEGREVRDLALVLGRGGSISGTVRWPDGSPAEAALVLEPHRSGLEWDGGTDEVTGKSDASGAFTISGLSHESYRVQASATRSDETLPVQPEFTGTGRPRKAERTQWRAEAERVQIGTEDLALTLSTGLSVAGRVVDDLGTAQRDFVVMADRIESGSGMDLAPELTRSFHDTDGSFRMDGFTPGEWELSALAREHGPSEPVRLSLPGGGPVVLVVPREAVLRGRVLDPGGAPLAEAAVEVESESSRRSSVWWAGEDRLTDEEGFFEVRGLGPGPVLVQAHGASFAPCEPLRLELLTGETRDLVLRLRPGATILGEVAGGDGRPQAALRVGINGPHEFHCEAETDAEGRFRAEGLPPGELSLRARTEEGIHLQQEVTLAEGETARVRLAPPGGAVRLHGHVRAGDEPLAGASIYASRAGEPGVARATASSDADESGAYELELPGPGRYRLSVSASEALQLAWSTTVDAPAVAELAFDVSVPVGRISGRVIDGHGQPLADVIVHSEPERHEGGAHGWALARSAADGRYELLVPAGQHAVFAGGSRTWGLVAEGQNYTEARVGGLAVVESGHVRGVDLVLAPGGILAGVVRDADGRTAGRAELFEDDGTSLGLSDENGRFEIPGVAPGTHRIRARARSAATRESVQVELRAGETHRIELELSPATLVRLTVLQGGIPVGSELRVLDGQGRAQMVDTSENGKAACGPLTPGRYTVRAQRDGKTVERELEVAPGQKELALELVFE